MGVSTSEETRSAVVHTVGLQEEKDADGKLTTLRIARIGARQGETVRWDLGDRRVSIWFPDTGVFVSPVLAVVHRGPVEAVIPKDAEDGEYEYCIYDHDARMFVECESHPKLAIPGP